MVKYATLLSIVLIFAIVVSQVSVLTPTVKAVDSLDRNYWLSLARTAWQYFGVGTSVNRQTGLHSSGIGWHYFNDWDLGTYIQATLDAEHLGIIQTTGEWSATDRLNKSLNFLETRPLSKNNLPWGSYNSETGEKDTDSSVVEANPCDTGKLLVALSNLKIAHPEFASRINNFVYGGRVDFAFFNHAIDQLTNSTNIYDYYVASGFSSFFPERFTPVANSIINSIAAAPKVTTYGVQIPAAKLTSEVVLHCVFELPPNQKLLNIADQIYYVHEGRYNVTGKLCAWSEGNTALETPSYIYEWVVYTDGRTWTLRTTTQAESQITPIIFLKVAVGFEATHDTAFSRDTVEYVQSHLQARGTGFQDGVDENGRLVFTVIDKTNGLVMGAARYAIDRLPGSSPSPSPSPSASPTESFWPTPSPTPYPSTETSSPTATVFRTEAPSVSSTLSPTPTITSTSSATSSPSESPPPISTSPSATPTASQSAAVFQRPQDLTAAFVVMGVVVCLLVLLPAAVFFTKHNATKKQDV